LLKDLIEHFSALNLGNANVKSDIIGDAYEYLIKQFADATGNKAGEFYTPRSVVRLMVDILDPKEGETIYDPACGTGGMLLGAVQHICDKGGDPRTFFGKLFGQERNLATASVADEIEKELDQALTRSERLRQSILKRAFEGRLMRQEKG
jgi:type I restriction enzyme M protein